MGYVSCFCYQEICFSTPNRTSAANNMASATAQVSSETSAVVFLGLLVSPVILSSEVCKYICWLRS